MFYYKPSYDLLLKSRYQFHFIDNNNNNPSIRSTIFFKIKIYFCLPANFTNSANAYMQYAFET